MTFDVALQLLREGRSVRRLAWRATLRVRDGRLWLLWPSGSLTNWEPTQEDLLAEDWSL